VDGFAALETDRDEGDGDGGGDALFWADFDFPLYARLSEQHELARLSCHQFEIPDVTAYRSSLPRRKEGGGDLPE
jgi:hypothetical protein